MLRKVIGVAAVAAVLLTASAPAGATTRATVMRASFGAPSAGSAQVVMRSRSFRSHIHVSGLAPGQYDYWIGVYQDTNGDGVPEGGTAVHVCGFTVRAGHTEGNCHGHGPSLLANWSAPDPPNLFRAVLDLVVPNSESFVGAANFS